MQNLLPEMKKYLPWLKEADSQALKYTCRQLNNAFDRFFKKLGAYPKFHTKHGKQSYTTTNASVIRIEPHRVKLPCLGWIRTSDKRVPDGKFCYATISLETDNRYYVSITYKKEVPDMETIKPSVNDASIPSGTDPLQCVRVMEARASWKFKGLLAMVDAGLLAPFMEGRVYAEWTGKYPNLCAGRWFLFVDGKDVSDQIPDELLRSEMNTFGLYASVDLTTNWDEITDWYQDGLGWKEWVAANRYWLKNITMDRKLQHEIYSAIQEQDWRHGSCGGCI